MKKSFNVLILANPVPTPRYAGVARFAREHGWHLTVEDPQCPPADWEGDGVVVMLSAENEALADAVQRYRRKKMPVVDMMLARPDINLPRVTGDNGAVGKLAAEHFGDRAFTNLAWYSTKWSPIEASRFEAFTKNARRSSPEKWVWSDAGKPGIRRVLFSCGTFHLSSSYRAGNSPAAQKPQSGNSYRWL